MKKILVAALLISAPALAMAQKSGKMDERRTLTAEQRAERQTARLDKVVQLTPEQRQKIQAENLRTAEAMQPHLEAIRKERQAMRELGKRRREAYASILTPEQKERLEAARKEHRQARSADGGRAPHRGRTGMQAAPAPKE